MSNNAFAKDSAHAAPKLDVIQTKNGKLYRVTYAGMTREHFQEWQARCWFEQVLDMWRHRVRLSAARQYLASQSSDRCSARRNDSC
jgi:hypothetical protein